MEQLLEAMWRDSDYVRCSVHTECPLCMEQSSWYHLLISFHGNTENVGIPGATM